MSPNSEALHDQVVRARSLAEAMSRRPGRDELHRRVVQMIADLEELLATASRRDQAA